MSKPQASPLLISLLWLPVYALLWWLLTGGSGWYLGIPTILLAVWLSRTLSLIPWVIRPARLPALLGLFFRELFAGGWDVARRALHPRMPLDPAWVQYPLTTTDEDVRLLLSGIIGLMPGTLATAIDGDCLTLHVLDRDMPWESNIARLESRLVDLMGARLT